MPDSMQKKSLRITRVETDRLKKQYNAILNKEASLLPAIEIYELDNGSAIVYNSVRNKFTFYYDKADIILPPERRRPRDIMEDFQSEMKAFPGNKDSILLKLSEDLNAVIDPKNLEKSYLDSISKSVKKYSTHSDIHKLFFGLVVFLGEEIICHKGGKWDIKTVNFPVPNLLKPFLVDSSGKQEIFFIKTIQDNIEENPRKFDWYILAIFSTSSQRLRVF
jgi:hypothetical protein